MDDKSTALIGMAITPSQALRLATALEQAGIDPSTLSAENPFLLTTSRAREIQATVQSLAPDLAAELAKEVPPSLGYLALQERAKTEAVDISQLADGPLKQEVLLRDGPTLQAQQQESIKQQLADLEAGADALRKQNQADGLLASDEALRRQSLSNWQARFHEDQRQLKALETAAARRVV